MCERVYIFYTWYSLNTLKYVYVTFVNKKKGSYIIRWSKGRNTIRENPIKLLFMGN